LPNLHLDLQEWQRVAASAANLSTLLTEGRAQLITFIHDADRTLADISDFSTSIKQTVPLTPLDTTHYDGILARHSIFVYIAFAAASSVFILTIAIACCTYADAIRDCLNRPDPDPVRNRDQLVVRFSDERLRFIDTDQPLDKPRKTRRTKRALTDNTA
jgi:hypothetical protein